MHSKQKIGKIGEELAVNYLLKQGYQILDRNFQTKQGEIDIIAKQKEEIVFIEVKTRTNSQYGSPGESVGLIKQKHIYHTAQYYLYKAKLESSYTRIDVIEIYISPAKIRINHIKKAFCG